MQPPPAAGAIRQLTDVASLALEEARRQGASQCEADASLSQGLSVSVRLREVDTLEYQRDRGLGVTVYFGQRKGSASTADLTAAAVRETVEKACAIARYTAADPYAGLVEPEALAREIPDLDLDHAWDLAPERAIELARECEAAGLAVDARITNSEGASVSSQRNTGVYGNSLGFLAGYTATSHSISCSLIAQAGDDMQRDYWYTVARDPAELEAVASVGRTAGVRAVARLDARRLTTRKVPVAFTPDMARGLFRHLVGAIRARSQYRKSSFLLNAAGEQIFPAFLQMQERPHIRKGLASAPFDQEGAATRDRQLVRDGALDAAGFLRRLDTGLLVTELMGQGVNGVTGDYSRGASGFWVEHGAIVHPVHEITIAGTLRPMYRHIVALGDDCDVRGGIRTGSVLLSEMTIAGE